MIGGVIDGKYRVLRLIGRGGMGAVYEAEDLRPEAPSGRRVVAVKVMNPPGSGERDEAGNATRFEREARAAKAIVSEHVASVLDFGTDPATGMPYMVMEYLVGEDLGALLKRTDALPPGVALRIVAQACLGLQKAHEARVIHRDIKPANIFLARVGNGSIVVKVLDFGIAKIRPDDEAGETTGLTRPGGMLGSPIYMSPEQARGIRNIDHRTDIWSLGVVLYRALTGHTPHDDTEALGDLIVAICSNAPRPVQELSPWVPGEVAAIAHGALLIPASERWPSAEAMFEAMGPFLPDGYDLEEEMLMAIDEAARSVVAPRAPDLTTISGAQRTHATTAGTQVVASAATSPPPRRPPSPLWTVAAAAIAALAGVAVASFYYQTIAPVRRDAAGSPVLPHVSAAGEQDAASTVPQTPLDGGAHATSSSSGSMGHAP